LPGFIASAVASEVERYLRTGETDPYMAAWPGTWSERAERSRHDLRTALVGKVNQIDSRRSILEVAVQNSVALVRRKVRPMVHGLFPPSDRAAVMDLLDHSVVFVTSENIKRLLLEQRWDRTAWNLANLYLDSVGAELLDPNAQRLVGLSEETTCYVSPAYFERQEPFADFVVHEVAHIFHNCKRASVGLKRTLRGEWLLDIAFNKRETFAYACEVYSRVVDRARDIAGRRRLAAGFGAQDHFSDPRGDLDGLTMIVREAVSVRNGWQVILKSCG
jgi:hypothetical protein